MPGNASSHDLIVVGAGINGAAIAREASLRGLRSLLVDQGDVAAGVTSASTRLIHGGLRYLEHAELSLVRQSLAERERLLRLAPHLVTPLRLYLPVYAQGRRRLWQIRLGLFLYERLFRSQLLPRHAMLSAEETRRRLPGLRAVGLGGAATYFDAQVAFPERLVVENVRDAVRHGAELATYTRVTEIATQEGGVRGVRWLDGAGRRGAARASVVVNAAGPWVDRVLGPLAARPLVGGSKGSHLILAPFPGAPDAAVHAEASDGRPFFVIPWNGLFLIGTTEQGYGGDPGAATVTEAERAYLVREAQTLFPSAGGLSAAVRYTQSGVRPLPSTRRSDLGAVTRRHLIHRHRGVRGLYSVVGGKLTTHRDLAEDVLHVLADALADAKGPSPTRDRPLPGAAAPQLREEILEDVAARLGPLHARRLWSIYGAASAEVAASVREQPELAAELGQSRPILAAELVRAIEVEWATSLIDILQRRCMAGLGPDFGLGAAEAAAEWLAQAGLWGRQRAARELAEYRAYARRRQASAAGSP